MVTLKYWTWEIRVFAWSHVSSQVNENSGFLVPDSHKAALRPLRTLDWEPVTITQQKLSLVEKEEPVEDCFLLCLREQMST